jgi:hypothetical protein
MDMMNKTKEVKTRKFAHVTKNDNKVVNIFDWSEDIDPDLGEQNLLLDITELTGDPNIGDIYNGKGFTAPTVEEVKEETPVAEETKEDIIKQINSLLSKLQEKIEKL